MGGGKSSSTSSTDQAQTALSADGLVTGQVFNVSGRENTNFSYTDEYPQEVADLVNKVIDFATDIAGGAAEAYEGAQKSVSEAYQTAKQPDLDLVKQNTNYIPYIIGGSLLAVVAIVWSLK